MLGFVTDELVWTICRERAEEARSTHPHTQRKPEPEFLTPDPSQAVIVWVANALRGSVARPARHTR